MIIKKVINNNIVSAVNERGDELILMGKGIAFQKKAGDVISKSKIEKKFYLEDAGLYEKYKKLLEEVSAEELELAHDIISYAKKTLKKNLNESLYISLPDHISLAVERVRKGLEVTNALLWEIKRVHQEEYAVAVTALNMIENKLGVRLPEDEAGFIAFHLVNAELNEEMQNVVDITKFMKDILKIVEYHFTIILDEDSLNYHRFVTHLKFFAQRIFNQNAMAEEDGTLYEVVKNSYPQAFQCVEKISMFILTKYEHVMSRDEKLYLTIHIERIVRRDI
ncbi:PRD domain-containing protein [Paenibacillus illinoisensis]|uniref:BglG family transcription antiterminator LicT n=1 Tax=Paenibacillus illinoisensis TaxID=59845 RepID=UPI003D2C611E